MTDAEIDAMQPGREMDKAVAEALGWTPAPPGFSGFLTMPCGDIAVPSEFSTSRDAAMEALEKYGDYGITKVGGEYWVLLTDILVDLDEPWPELTLPLAICRALLKAARRNHEAE